mgnify:CR=1 FL=1
MAIVVLTTGGTIASVRGVDGRIAPVAGGLDVVLADPDVVVRNVMAVDSSTMTLSSMAAIRDAVATALVDPRVVGVVVLHGTDTLEETAMFLDLFHDDPRPVVLTGAQRPADHPDPDGPHNVEFAIATAYRNHNTGVLVAFGDRVVPARGTRKANTTELDAYENYLPVRWPRETIAWHPEIAQTRVDIVALYPGADRTHLDASVAAGARGIVLDAMGSGNANPNILAAVERCVANGIAVVVTSRYAGSLSAAATLGDG